MPKETITQHIERSKDKEFMFYCLSKHKKDENKFIILRPLGVQEYWMEIETGEGTGVSSGIIYDVLRKLFKEAM